MHPRARMPESQYEEYSGKYGLSLGCIGFYEWDIC